MEENLTNTNNAEFACEEPTCVDNSYQVEDATSLELSQLGGQSQDPSEGLILGKFKSVEDLSRAYEELQRFQGQNSQELGNLRKESESVNGLKGQLEEMLEMQNSMLEVISADKEKFNKPEYFQDPTFTELYKEAFYALNGQIDTDKFVSLLDSYVKSRVNAYEKSKSADLETQNVLDSMTYDKNAKTTFTPPKKTFDEMTPQEVDELLERLI